MGIKGIYEGRNNKQLFQNIRLGVITKVNFDIKSDDILADRNAYGTVSVEWIEDGLTVSQRTNLMFPLAGDGWGIYGCPEEGDLAIGAFKTGGIPIIIGYIRKSAINQLGQVDKNNELILDTNGEQQPTIASVPVDQKNNTFIPIRPLIPGEIFLRSKEMSEIYMDRNGSFRLIARTKRTDLTSKTMTSRLFQMILGESYGDDLKTAILDKFGKIYHLYLKHIKGSSLGFNERGDLTIDVKGIDSNNEASIDLTVQKELLFTCGRSIVSVTKEGLISFKNDSGQEISLDNTGQTVTIKDQSGNSIVMNGTSINIGSSATSFAVVGELILEILNKMASKFNSHTHTVSTTGTAAAQTGTAAPSSGPMDIINSSDIFSKKVKVE